jgi:hypothetical protein
LAIGGGAAWYSYNDDIIDRARRGAIWRSGPDGPVVATDDDPIALVVEGYPERRTFQEPNSIVVVTMKRRSGSIPIIRLEVQLALLAERPYIVQREVSY